MYDFAGYSWLTGGSYQGRLDEIQNCQPMAEPLPRDWNKGRCVWLGSSSDFEMPLKSAITQTRLENIIVCLNAAVTTVERVSTGLQTPFLEPIVNTVCSLLTAAQVIIGDPDHTVVDRIFTDDQEEQARMCGNARENLPAAVCNHSSAHNVQHWG
jgi:hypothetical protein